jgi:thymidylate synthase
MLYFVLILEMNMKQYQDAVREVLRNGTRKENRTGVDTVSTFDVSYKHDLRNGFPLLTTKKVSWKNIVVENLWFLSGDPHIDILQRHKCKFWDAWVENRVVPSAYGNFWRHFPVHDAEEGTYTEFDGESPHPSLRGWNDQVEWALAELKRNPMSRRIVISAWAPGNAQTSKLPPCHVVWVLNVQNLPGICPSCIGTGRSPGEDICSPCQCTGRTGELEQRLCLHLTQRSCDIALGVPYNLAGYAFLLELFSHLTGIKPGIFGHTLVDAHAYTCKPDGSMAEFDHVPGLKEQLTREPRPLPRLTISPAIKSLDDINPLMRDADTKTVMEHFVLEGYNPHPAISFKVAV